MDEFHAILLVDGRLSHCHSNQVLELLELIVERKPEQFYLFYGSYYEDVLELEDKGLIKVRDHLELVARLCELQKSQTERTSPELEEEAEE